MRHVLVVEDDAHNARLFRQILEKRGGWRVTVTESAEDVLRLAGAGEVDLVVMDVSLTGTTWQGDPLNGLELCRLLKADPAAAPVPVLLATAHAMRGDPERMLAESGADGYVAKPILDHAAFVAQAAALMREAA